MSNPHNLKPCPFCGGEARDDKMGVSCYDSDCAGCRVYCTPRLWNTRTDPLVQELVGALSDAINYMGRGYMGDARELMDRLVELRNRASRARSE